MKLLKVYVSAGGNDRSEIKYKELDVKESQKSYISPGIRIDKAKILKPDSISHNWGLTLSYFTYCLPEDLQLAKDVLRETVISTYNEKKEQFDRLTQSISGIL